MVKLTQYSHGGGCGCKISPQVLETILRTQLPEQHFPSLVVGNASRDDAAVVDIGNNQGIVSTTDFFMPIVDNPNDFGRIAATNALSDIYAMGARPLMAIAILGWPVQKLSPEIAQAVVDGGRRACIQAGIPLCGGHSIDSPEPIFGLAVTGIVDLDHVKRNNTARPGCVLYLTKPLGIGVLTTAEKKGVLREEHARIATDVMCQLNTLGMALGRVSEVQALTDVTGFGLLGHLLELCEGSHVHARLDFDAVPKLPYALDYARQGCVPGGTSRNFESYGHKVRRQTPDGTFSSDLLEAQKHLLCDPQTSGGLLIAVTPGRGETRLQEIARQHGLPGLKAIGVLEPLPQDCKDQGACWFVTVMDGTTE